MRSFTESPAAAVPARRMADSLSAWNRRIHYYLGLYLLLFLWQFSFTGMLLNHPRWTFAEFWANRQQTSFELPIQAPPPGGDLVQARDIMRQAGVHGEIDWTRSRTDPSRLDFRASRPGHIFEIKTDLQQGRSTVQRIDLNAWGVARILHTFTGVRMTDSRNQRDWMWAWSRSSWDRSAVVSSSSGFGCLSSGSIGVLDVGRAAGRLRGRLSLNDQPLTDQSD